MKAELGDLPLTVRTGSGKGHAYVQWEPDLPAKIWWKGVIVGECQRGGGRLQHVVFPPSTHPTGGKYKWLTDPRLEVAELPHAWRDYLMRRTISAAATATLPAPDFVLPGDTRGTENASPAVWDGPPTNEIIRRALRQQGAVTRGDGGIKFRCLGCEREGRDRHFDNARVGPDGRWGCAVNPEHKRAIAEQLGVLR
jgi:hypothetical protein